MDIAKVEDKKINKAFVCFLPSEMFTFVTNDWLDVIIPWTRLSFDFFEALWFADSTLELLLLLNFVVSHSCLVFRDKIGPCWLWNCRSHSVLNALRNCISSNARMISNKRCWLGSWNRILWTLFNLYFISSWGRIINNFIIWLISRCRDDHIFVIFRGICVWVILNNEDYTSEGPGCLLVLKTSLFYFGILYSWQLLKWVGSGWYY